MVIRMNRMRKHCGKRMNEERKTKKKKKTFATTLIDDIEKLILLRVGAYNQPEV